MIKPPPVPITNPLSVVAEREPERLSQHLEFFTPLDDKGRYLPFDELRFRIPRDLDPTLVWSVVKQARQRQLNPVITLGDRAVPGMLLLTPAMQVASADPDGPPGAAARDWRSG